MTVVSLEERVALLEADMRELKRQLVRDEQTAVAWWDQIAGTFVDDLIFEEAMQSGRAYRIAQGSGGRDAQDHHVSP